MKLIEQVVEILSENKKAMHVDDIAEALIKKYPNVAIPADKLPAKISSTLSSNIKNKRKKSLFTKPKNKQGGLKRGMYKLKSPGKALSKKFKVPEQPKVTTQYTGKAGEYSVLSELLFFGFNASVMTVDDGIDVVASKENSYFHIQVKTSNISNTGKYRFNLTQRAFDAKSSSSTFYILVMRSFDGSRYFTDHLVLPNSLLRQLVENATIRSGTSLSFTIEKIRGGQLLLNGIVDVTWSLNRYDTIN